MVVVPRSNRFLVVGGQRHELDGRHLRGGGRAGGKKHGGLVVAVAERVRFKMENQ